MLRRAARAAARPSLLRAPRGLLLQHQNLQRALSTASSSNDRPTSEVSILDVLRVSTHSNMKHVLETQVRLPKTRRAHARSDSP